MKIIAAFLLGLVTAIPIGVVSYNIGANLADSYWEYKTQYMQEELDNLKMRERILYSLPTNGKEPARALNRA